MPVCKFHGKWPCVDCLIKNYYICVEENKTRTESLHDVEGLKRSIEELGGEV
jgi:hypothetical protein